VELLRAQRTLSLRLTGQLASSSTALAWDLITFAHICVIHLVTAVDLGVAINPMQAGLESLTRGT
jgi:hypothetical protein